MYMSLDKESESKIMKRLVGGGDDICNTYHKTLYQAEFHGRKRNTLLQCKKGKLKKYGKRQAFTRENSNAR